MTGFSNFRHHSEMSGMGAHNSGPFVSTGAASCTGANSRSPSHGETIQLAWTGGSQNAIFPNGCSPWKTRDMSNRLLLVLRMSGFLVQHQHGLAGFGFRVGIGGGAVRQLGPDARPVVRAEFLTRDPSPTLLFKRYAMLGRELARPTGPRPDGTTVFVAESARNVGVAIEDLNYPGSAGDAGFTHAPSLIYLDAIVKAS